MISNKNMISWYHMWYHIWYFILSQVYMKGVISYVTSHMISCVILIYPFLGSCDIMHFCMMWIMYDITHILDSGQVFACPANVYPKSERLLLDHATETKHARLGYIFTSLTRRFDLLNASITLPAKDGLDKEHFNIYI